MEQSLANELTLISEYRKVNRYIYDIEFEKQYSKDGLTNQKENELNSHYESRRKLADELKNSTFRPATIGLIDIVCRQIDAIVEKLHDNDFGLKLSLNQGMIWNTFLFTQISKYIMESFDGSGAVNLPKFYYEETSAFDPSELKELLTKYRNLLRKNWRDLNFLDVEQIVNELYESILILQSNETKKLKG